MGGSNRSPCQKRAFKANTPTAEVPIATRTEKKQVEERLAIGPHVVYETIRREGEQELLRKSSALAWSAFAAGWSMGFSFIAEALLMAHLLGDNIIRGFSLVAALGHAQVVWGREGKDKKARVVPIQAKRRGPSLSQEEKAASLTTAR